MGFLKRVLQKDEQNDLEYQIGILLKKLNSDDPAIRRSAMEDLEDIGMEIVLDTLIEILIETEDDEFRYYVITGLARIGTEQVVEVFIDILDHEDADIRYFAIKGLWKTGTELLDMGSMEARSHKELEDRTRPIPAQDNSVIMQAVEGLISALDDEDAANRQAAIKGLGEIGTERAVQGLIQALHDENPGNRGTAIAGLGIIGSEGAVEELISALQDENADNRENAISWLEGIGTKRAVQGLIMALNDDDDEIRDITLSILEDHGEETMSGMKEAIRKMIVSSDPRERRNGLYCLESCDTDQFENRLIGALADPDNEVRIFAIENLLTIDSDQVETGLMKAIHGDDPDILGSIILVFDRLGAEQSAVERAIEALYSEDMTICREGIRSLKEMYGEHKSEQRMYELIKEISDENQIRREMAVYSLGELGNRKAIPYLEDLLDDTTHTRLGYYGSRTISELVRKAITKIRESDNGQPDSGSGNGVVKE